MIALLMALALQGPVDGPPPWPVARRAERAGLTESAVLLPEADPRPEAVAASVLGGRWRLVMSQPPSLTSDQRFLLERIERDHPIADEIARVNYLRDGRVWVYGHRTTLTGDPVPAALTRAAAEELARASVATAWEARAFDARLEWLGAVHGAQLVWRVDLVSSGADSFAWRVRVDARRGTVLELEERATRHAGVNGAGAGFLPNPVQTLGDGTLRDHDDSAFAVPHSAYHQVVLRDLDGSGYLDGPWASTASTRNRSFRANLNFTAFRNQLEFEEVMGYAHVDTMQRRLQGLGIHARREQQRMDVADLLFDRWEYANASYNQFSNVMFFGTLGVDFAEDADVLLHEYGHSLHDNLQGGLGKQENAALSEGFSDFLACLQADDALLGEWVATSIPPEGSVRWVRRCDELKRHPMALVGDPHADGEIWSGALWETRHFLGDDVMLQLATEALALGTQNTDMPGAARNLRLADQLLHQGAHERYLLGPLGRAGLVPTPSGEPTLGASERRLRHGEAVELRLRDATRPGSAFQIVFSASATPADAGAPFNVKLDLGNELVARCMSEPALSGSLDAFGEATIRLPAAPIRHGAVWFAQAMVLDATGMAEALTAPIAFRAERL